MLYYTGALQPQAIQDNPSLSLGGYISSSPVPNDVMNNLFSNIGYDTVKNNLKQVRVIAFLNTTGVPINTFSVYTNTDLKSFAKLKVGLVLNAIDTSCNIPYFETIPVETATPVYVGLVECEGEVNKISISNIPVNNYVGIFLQRELIPENNDDFGGTSKTCNDFAQEFDLKKAAETNPTIIIPPKREEDTIELVFEIE